MKISINEIEKEVQTSALQKVLEELGLYQERGLAAAVNGQLVPKSTWPSHELQENDQIVLIQATQGG